MESPNMQSYFDEKNPQEQREREREGGDGKRLPNDKRYRDYEEKHSREAVTKSQTMQDRHIKLSDINRKSYM